MLRECISRKLFKPGGCERLFEEVKFELRSEGKELILHEEGKGGARPKQRLWRGRGGSCRFEDLKDRQGHCNTEERGADPGRRREPGQVGDLQQGSR